MLPLIQSTISVLGAPLLRDEWYVLFAPLKDKNQRDSGMYTCLCTFCTGSVNCQSQNYFPKIIITPLFFSLPPPPPPPPSPPPPLFFFFLFFFFLFLFLFNGIFNSETLFWSLNFSLFCCFEHQVYILPQWRRHHYAYSHCDVTATKWRTLI